MAFFLHRSNRQERLLDALIDLLDGPRADPFAPEPIVVQGRGIERWITQQVARQHGVCCNLRFVYPRQAVTEVLQEVLERPLELQAFEPEQLMWTLARRLPELIEQPELSTLQSYLCDHRDPQETALDERRLFALSERLARVYSDYLAYRPQMIADWQRGVLGELEVEQRWQATLWRALLPDLGEDNLATLSMRALGTLRSRLQARTDPSGTAPAGAPGRLCLFGLSTLPPLYLRLLIAAASHIDVHLFVLSPSQEYWADIQTQGEARRRDRQHAALGHDEGTAQHRDLGHELLASLGRQGRDLAALIDGLQPGPDEERESYQEPGQGCALHVLQSDMLSLRRRGATPSVSLFAATEPRAPLPPGDRSIQVHRCHSRMREVEVLRDALLDAFEHLPGLQPSDIVVMAPDIDAYAPLIEAVFGAEVQGQRLCFSVADRAASAQRVLVDAMDDLLRYTRGRFDAAGLMALLDHAPLREAAGLSGDDVDTLGAWLQDCHVTWGLDREQRETQGAAAQPVHTWAWALQRWLLGVAVDGAQAPLVGDLAPYDDMEGDNRELLGRVADLIDRLRELRAQLQRRQTIREWQRSLRPLLHALLASDDDLEASTQGLDAALAEIDARAERAAFDQPVDGDSFVQLLQPLLEATRGSQDFLRGGVTFCSLLPMRSIPFRVVALLGMSDQDFPRRQRGIGFDLVALHPCRGDRRPGDDDRTLFLDALLSARERLLLSYVGRDPASGQEQPPSVLLADLLDCVDQSFDVEGPGPASRHITVEHARDAHDRSYFDGSRAERFSYDSALAAALATVSAQPAVVEPRLPLLPPTHEHGEGALSLDALTRFFKNPTRGFFIDRLGLRFSRELRELPQQDLITWDALQRHHIVRSLLETWDERADAHPDLDVSYRLLAAQGVLPAGHFGRVHYQKIATPLAQLWTSLHDLLRRPRQAPLELRVEHEGNVVFARLPGLRGGQLVQLSASTAHGRALLDFWLAHLALSAALGTQARDSLFVDGKGQRLRLRPVAEATALLGRLVELRRLGLRRPLPFFAKEAWVYCQELACGTSATQALARAQKIYRGSSWSPGSSADAYVHEAYGDHDPLGQTRLADLDDVPALTPELGFCQLAVLVFAPLQRHLTGED